MQYRNYEDEILKKIKAEEKEILIKFISICEKYNLKYFVTFGTLLGAIRHEGFIPWDDDVDVGMLREDYEKFLEVAQKECGERFFLQTIETDPYYHLYFSKLRMSNTVFVENTLQQSNSVSGFYIDIFPYDTIPDDKKLMKRQIKKSVILGMLLSINKVKEPQIGNYGILKQTLLRAIWIILHYGMKWLHISGENVWKLFKKSCMMYQGQEYENLVTFSADAEKWIIHKSEVDNLLDQKFEDIFVKVPIGYNKILNRCYGDYMKLPPECQRENHMPIKIKFSDEKEVIILKEE